jgi:hypothetical protein
MQPIASHARDTITPKITAARMTDLDGDNKADRVVLTYSEKINHSLDTDGSYPFTVGTYKITKVGKAASTRTLVVFLKEKLNSDITAKPSVKYTRTTRQPVLDLAKNQARGQTFSGTIRLDRDLDGYAANDCAPTDPAINPGEDDHPDEAFIDVNCDGIDGEETSAIFVATSGTDSVDCGTKASPCATPQHGIVRAAQDDQRDVYIQAGTYSDASFYLVNGVNVYGGYDLTWVRGAGVGHESRVVGDPSPPYLAGEAQAMTVLAANLIVPTTLADMTLVGPDMTVPGKSSYTVVVKNTSSPNLTIARNIIEAGDGAAGQTGSVGTSASLVSATAGMNGITGGGGVEQVDCNSSSHGAGGDGGLNSGPGGSPMNGGSGGAGGEMDTSCPFSLNATSGDAGGNAATNVPPNFGIGGPGGAANVSGCNSSAPLSEGSPGKPGRVLNGSAGLAGTGGGLDPQLWYLGEAGGAGATGQNGGGGGGGGGSGGCDDGTDAWGAGGGGGGAGGLAAQGAGGGGQAGGSSFAIYLIDSSPILTNNTIYLGTGGDGGAGGTGGRGQSGGQGAPGGEGVGAGDGGDGGNGGHGGHGGGGGGGAGGIVVGIYRATNSTVNDGGTTTFIGGTAGAGGSGGESAPSAPLAEQDGNDGPAGSSGMVSNVGTCASLGSC